MKLSDFYINSRRFFGYLAPGAMWLGVIYLSIGRSLSKISSNEKFEWIEAALGNPWITATALVLVSYSLGYVVQRISFRKYDRKPEIKINFKKKVEEHFKTIFNLNTNKEIDGYYLSEFCSWYVLENSTHLKAILFEKEVEINSAVAIPPPLFFLLCSIAVAGFVANDLVLKIFGIIGSILTGSIWIWMWVKVKEMRKEERIMWYEMFLLIRSLDKCRTDGEDHNSVSTKSNS